MSGTYRSTETSLLPTWQVDRVVPPRGPGESWLVYLSYGPDGVPPDGCIVSSDGTVVAGIGHSFQEAKRMAERLVVFMDEVRRRSRDG